MGPLGCGNVTKLFKNMITASEALIVYEALQIAKAAGMDYKAALDLMQKTKSQHVLDRWDMRFRPNGRQLEVQRGAPISTIKIFLWLRKWAKPLEPAFR